MVFFTKSPIERDYNVMAEKKPLYYNILRGFYKDFQNSKKIQMKPFLRFIHFVILFIAHAFNKSTKIREVKDCPLKDWNWFSSSFSRSCDGLCDVTAR